MNDETVLVTGGTGFLGGYCILRLLRAGYRVRTTLRDLRRADDVREILLRGGADPSAPVEYVPADLTRDDGWAEAVAGCAYVLHVASPFPPRAPRDENELIVPARDGSLRVLRAARDAGVRRVVLTSSFAAIGYGHEHSHGHGHGHANHVLTELDWTDPDAPGVGAYQRSKTLAERAAWDFVEREGGALELAVVNPVGIVGPLLGAPTTSIEMVRQLVDGAVPALPRLSYGIVDVRDVADLHLLAMTDPAARGERFLATAGDSLWVADIARILREGLGEAGSHVPTRTLPDFAVRGLALVVPSLRPMVPELGNFKSVSNAKARRLLGWQPRSAEDSLIATGESLVSRGLLKHR